MQSSHISEKRRGNETVLNDYNTVELYLLEIVDASNFFLPVQRISYWNNALEIAIKSKIIAVNS